MRKWKVVSRAKRVDADICASIFGGDVAGVSVFKLSYGFVFHAAMNVAYLWLCVLNVLLAIIAL